MTWRRLAAKIGLDTAMDEVGADFFKGAGDGGVGSQCGVRVPNGAEAILHATNRLLEEHQARDDWSLLTIDFANAFNSLDRGTIFNEVATHCPRVLPLVTLLYQSPTHLFHGQFKIASQTGVQQGDPLGPFLFALGIHQRIIKKVGEACPSLAFNAWFLDDGTIVGPSAEVRRALSIIEQEGAKLGLRVNLDKCELFWPTANRDHLESGPFPAQLSRARSGVKLLGGAATLDPAFHASIFQRRVDKAKTLMETLHLLENPQHELLLLRACAAGLRVQYGLRCTPPAYIAPQVAAFDEALLECLRVIVVAGGGASVISKLTWLVFPWTAAVSVLPGLLTVTFFLSNV